jgi:capsule polysaccharide export protein KpsE/RkpR
MSVRNGSPAISPDVREHGVASGQLEAQLEEGTDSSAESVANDPMPPPNWVANTSLLWLKRRILLRTAGISLVIALAIAFLWPKQYESSARILPPANSMGGAAMLAALAGRSSGSLGALGALAGGFLGGGGNTPLFVDLLRSGSIAGQLIDRFDLQRVYGKRYRIDAAKSLARRTKIVDDKKSGVITITVTDTDPVRARDMAQAYLEELNRLVNRTSTSSARQERLFIEERLRGVQADLDKAQQRLSEFSSTHSTIDIKEQGRAMVDAASRLQSQLIVEQSGLDSLRQTYGDENIRVRSAQARIAGLQAEIAKISGSSQALPADASGTDSGQAGASGTGASSGNDLYPPLRQLPRLAVPYANLYREVKVQEGVYELLTQQYELARIQEAKDVPVVSVIDSPGIPEKKSFPPRLLMAFLLMVASVAVACLALLMQRQWQQVPASDPRKVLAHEVGRSVQRRLAAWAPRTKGVQ